MRFPLRIWIGFLPLFLFFIFPVVALNNGEIEALTDMQSEWSPYGWTGEPTCSWPGLTCDVNGNLQQISLGNQKLSGTIPESIGNLQNLNDLILATNQLTGTIPSSFANLQMLASVQLAGNQLSGTLDSLANLNPSIEEIDIVLSSNQFSGTIPAALTALPTLVYLYLASNQLTGSIPPFSNPPYYFLGGVDLSGNSLMGEIPDSVCDLSQLGRLNLASNNLQGVIPECLGSLTRLTIIDLSLNQLTGTISSSLGLLTTDQNEVHLDNNQLSGSIPSTFGSLPNLWSFTAANNQLSGLVPSSICAIHTLVLTGNSFSCPLPGCCTPWICGTCSSSSTTSQTIIPITSTTTLPTTSTTTTTTGIIIPGATTIGLGLNCITGELLQNPVLSVFSTNQFYPYYHPSLNISAVPSTLSIVPLPAAGVDSFSFFTATEFSQFQSVEYGLTENIPIDDTPALLSLSEQFQSIHDSLKAGSNFLVYIREFVTLYQLRFQFNAHNISDLLTPDFLNNQAALPVNIQNITSSTQYRNFVSLYGTHVLVEATFGGISELFGYFDWDYLATGSLQSATLNGKLSYSELKLGIGQAYTRQSAADSFHSSLQGSLSHVFRGGKSSLSLGDWLEWLPTIPTNPDPVKFQVRPITDFIIDPVRRQLLASYIQNYITSYTYTPASAPKLPPNVIGRCECSWYTPPSNENSFCPNKQFISGVTVGPNGQLDSPIYCCTGCIDFTALGYFSATNLDNLNAERKKILIVEPFSESRRCRNIAQNTLSCPPVPPTNCGSNLPCLPGIQSFGTGFDAATGQLVPQEIFVFSYSQGKTWNSINLGQIFAIPDQVQPIQTPTQSPVSVLISRSQAQVGWAEASQSTIGLPLTGGTFGLSLRARNSKHTFTGNQSLSVLASQITSSYEISLIPDPSAEQLSPAFSKAVLQLPTNSTNTTLLDVAYNTFIRTFGTHVSTAATYGGRAVLHVSIDANYFSTHSDDQISNSISALFAAFQDSQEISSSFAELNLASFAEFQLFGGDFETLNPQQPDFYSNWVNSAYCNPALVSSSLTPVTTLITDSTKSSLLAKYISAYLAQSVAPGDSVLESWIPQDSSGGGELGPPLAGDPYGMLSCAGELSGSVLFSGAGPYYSPITCSFSSFRFPNGTWIAWIGSSPSATTIQPSGGPATCPPNQFLIGVTAIDEGKKGDWLTSPCLCAGLVY